MYKVQHTIYYNFHLEKESDITRLETLENKKLLFGDIFMVLNECYMQKHLILYDRT